MLQTKYYWFDKAGETESAQNIWQEYIVLKEWDIKEKLAVGIEFIWIAFLGKDVVINAK